MRTSYRNSEMRQKFHFVSTFALRVTPDVIPAFEPESRLKSEIDACGVRGFGSVMPASMLAVATLASHAFELTTTSLVRNLSLFRI